MTPHYLSLLLALPLLGAVLVLAMPGRYDRGRRLVARGTACAGLLGALPLVALYNARLPEFQLLGRLGRERALLGLDGISLVCALVAVLIAAVAVLSLPDASRAATGRAAAWLLVTAGALGVLVSLDLWVMSAGWALALAGVYLVSRPATGEGPLDGARWFPVAGGASLVCLVVATLGAVSANASGGAADVSRLHEVTLSATGQWLVFGGSVGVLLFTWLAVLLPGAGTGPDESGVAGHGVLLTLAVYVLIRVGLPIAPDVSRAAGPMLAGASLVCAMVFGGIAVRRAGGTGTVSAYGASQAAVVVAAVATLRPEGLSGGVPQQAAVALSMVALPLLARMVAGGARVDEGRPAWSRLVLVGMGLVAVLAAEGPVGPGRLLWNGAAGARGTMLLGAAEIARLLGLAALALVVRRAWSAAGSAHAVSPGPGARAWGVLPAAAVIALAVAPGGVHERVTVPALKVASRIDASYTGAFEAACDTTVTDEMKAANPANQFLSAAPCGPDGAPLPSSSVIAPAEPTRVPGP